MSYLKNADDSEGIVQEVFIKLWKNRSELINLKSLNAWLYTVTFNEIRKFFRDRSAEEAKLSQYRFSALFDDDSVRLNSEYKSNIELAENIIKKLPGRQKEILMLKLKDGLNNMEISEKLKISQRTVENHISKARAKLKIVFKNQGLIDSDT